MRGLRLPLDRIRVALEAADLIRYFEACLYSGNEVRNSKPAPDLFLHVARKMYVEPGQCIVVEDSQVGVVAGVAAGMMVIGFAGGSHAGCHLDRNLRLAGAHRVITDMRGLPGAVIDLRGW